MEGGEGEVERPECTGGAPDRECKWSSGACQGRPLRCLPAPHLAFKVLTSTLQALNDLEAEQQSISSLKGYYKYISSTLPHRLMELLMNS